MNLAFVLAITALILAIIAIVLAVALDGARFLHKALRNDRDRLRRKVEEYDAAAMDRAMTRSLAVSKGNRSRAAKRAGQGE